MDQYRNNEQRGDQHIDRQPDLSNAARGIAKLQIELALREMLGEIPGPARLFKGVGPEQRRANLAPYLQGRFDLDDALVARFLGSEPEPWFVMQIEGAAPAPRAPLSDLLEANRDDTELCEWLNRAEPGASYMVGGGAAPAVSVRRVA